MVKIYKQRTYELNKDDIKKFKELFGINETIFSISMMPGTSSGIHEIGMRIVCCGTEEK